MQSKTSREIYFDADSAAGDLRQRLGRLGNPTDRAEVFEALATQCQIMAQAFPSAFGPDPIARENGRDLSESLASEAVLMDLLADVERAVAGGRRRLLYGTVLESVAGRTLDAMVGVTDADARAVMAREDLYRAVVATVGVQAAEALATLSVPR